MAGRHSVSNCSITRNDSNGHRRHEELIIHGIEECNERITWYVWIVLWSSEFLIKSDFHFNGRYLGDGRGMVPLPYLGTCRDAARIGPKGGKGWAKRFSISKTRVFRRLSFKFGRQGVGGLKERGVNCPNGPLPLFRYVPESGFE